MWLWSFCMNREHCGFVAPGGRGRRVGESEANKIKIKSAEALCLCRAGGRGAVQKGLG